MNERDRIYRKVKSIIREKNKSSYIGEDDLVTLQKEGIKINFHIKNRNLDIENVFRAVKRAEKVIKNKLDHDLENLCVDIHSSIEEMRQEGISKSRYASWIAGICDGDIRIISEQGDKEPEALYIILTHEIIHLAISEIGLGKCPYWLDEGVAVYLSQELNDQYLAILQEALRKDKILPLEILEKPVPVDAAEPLRQLAYSQSFSVVEYFIETRGWDKVRLIIDQSRRRPIKMILTDLGLNYYLIEQGWKRWVRERYA